MGWCWHRRIFGPQHVIILLSWDVSLSSTSSSLLMLSILGPLSPFPRMTLRLPVFLVIFHLVKRLALRRNSILVCLFFPAVFLQSVVVGTEVCGRILSSSDLKVQDALYSATFCFILTYLSWSDAELQTCVFFLCSRNNAKIPLRGFGGGLVFGCKTGALNLVTCLLGFHDLLVPLICLLLTGDSSGFPSREPLPKHSST